MIDPKYKHWTELPTFSNWDHFCLVSMENPYTMAMYACAIGLVVMYLSLVIGLWLGKLGGKNGTQDTTDSR
jgi:hypothetical protein